MGGDIEADSGFIVLCVEAFCFGLVFCYVVAKDSRFLITYIISN